MQFILTFRGQLPVKASLKDKQLIRRQFQPQLKQLWCTPPLSRHSNILLSEEQTIGPCIINRIKKFRFAPLVSTKLRTIVKLDILFLRPDIPGNIVSQGGDIDNRLKTLFDALRMPHSISELPKDDEPALDEDPFFCLLEDDALITELSIKTGMLLTESIHKSYAELIIQINTNAFDTGWGTHLGIS
jgi:hypothetical protein